MDVRKIGAVVALVVAAIGIGAAVWLTQGDAPTSAPSGAQDELLVNVDQIRAAELTLKGVFGSYAPCGTRDEALAAATASPRDWQGASCWVAVGWEPDGRVRGGYWVELTETGFKAGGVVRAGEYVVEATATDTSPAALAP